MSEKSGKELLQLFDYLKSIHDLEIQTDKLEAVVEQNRKIIKQLKQSVKLTYDTK